MTEPVEITGPVIDYTGPLSGVGLVIAPYGDLTILFAEVQSGGVTFRFELARFTEQSRADLFDRILRAAGFGHVDRERGGRLYLPPENEDG